MAKSLRSKWKRKMRAIKRVRYGVKELKQLKSVLQNLPGKKVNLSELCTDVSSEISKKTSENLDSNALGNLELHAEKSGEVSMTNNQNPQTITESKTESSVEASTSENQDPQTSAESKPEVMEIDRKSPYHPVRLTNEHGNYPVWMNQRAIKKHKAQLKRLGHVQKKHRQNKKTK